MGRINGKVEEMVPGEGNPNFTNRGILNWAGDGQIFFFPPREVGKDPWSILEEYDKISLVKCPDCWAVEDGKVSGFGVNGHDRSDDSRDLMGLGRLRGQSCQVGR